MAHSPFLPAHGGLFAERAFFGLWGEQQAVGAETAEGELEKPPARSEQWSPTAWLCVGGSRSCYE